MGIDKTIMQILIIIMLYLTIIFFAAIKVGIPFQMITLLGKNVIMHLYENLVLSSQSYVHNVSFCNFMPFFQLFQKSIAVPVELQV